jgi:two-component system response regulator FlrC
VLVVEAYTELRRWLVDVFALRGFQVTAAATGEEALLRLQAEPYDLVVTDFLGPCPNGWQLLAWARVRGLATPFIVASGFRIARERIVNGFPNARFLAKPFEEKTLVALADEMLARAVETE